MHACTRFIPYGEIHRQDCTVQAHGYRDINKLQLHVLAYLRLRTILDSGDHGGRPRSKRAASASAWTVKMCTKFISRDSDRLSVMTDQPTDRELVLKGKMLNGMKETCAFFPFT
jgi:hypothetical protein